MNVIAKIWSKKDSTPPVLPRGNCSQVSSEVSRYGHRYDAAAFVPKLRRAIVLAAFEAQQKSAPERIGGG
jgi:hypothetical protein